MEGKEEIVWELRRGDKIKIDYRGWIFEGIVLTAYNNASPNHVPMWYIEFVDLSGSYHYWKQQVDEGTLYKLGEANEQEKELLRSFLERMGE